ncbi:MAG: type II TA system antitoxin MqsA family protein [Candidatus Omnitrophota bacterium]
MAIIYCPHCDKDTQGQIGPKEEVFMVRGETVKIFSSVLSCLECQNDVFNEELDEKNLENAYNEYRKIHHLLSPNEIREIREKYGLSQRGLSRLLGWGEITLHRYESGGLQDEAHNTVLQLIAEPENMSRIYAKQSVLLSPIEAKKLEERISGLIAGCIEPKLNLKVEERLLREASDLTGHKQFDLEKTKNMILYILGFHKTFATKINKLLWYMDFLFFQKFSLSISGNCYLHLKYGPVPDGYDLIIGIMMNEKLIDKEEVFKHDCAQELLKPSMQSDKAIFSKEEVFVMNYVLEKFKDFTCKEISEYSHKEIPYKNTDEGEVISYNLADDLSLRI